MLLKKPATSRTKAVPPRKAASRKTASRGGSNGKVGLRVRMYRVGFGDFFLISVPAGNGQLHILIDCGVFKGQTGEGDIGTIDAAVDDLVEVTGGHLALVVMTHRHADHIIGFSRCKVQFQKMKVDAVWMPAWENEYDDKKSQKTRASHFQTALTGIAARMHQDLAAAGATPGREEEHEETMRLLLNATGPLAAAGGGTNAASLDLLKRGFGVTAEYYSAGDTPKIPEALARAGLSAQILGPPPLDDIAFMKLMDLKKGVGQYLAGMDGGDEGDDATDDSEEFSPFEQHWEVPPTAYPARASSEWQPPGIRKGKVEDAARAMQAALEKAQPASLLEAAKTLDSFLNNQSLVILFGYQGKKLLFAGDAQAGNWERWLYASGSPDKSGAAPVSEEAKAILDSIDFYKVGHHGSTNATPKAVVEALRSGIVAMCSTQPGVYGNEEKGTEVPRGPLMADLEKKVTVVRSDEVPAKVNGKAAATTEPLPDLPRGTAGELKQDLGWVEYIL
jgi:hypothetical protein